MIERLQPMLSAIRQAGGWPLIVGGAVRDWMLGLDCHDFDVEVYHLPAEQLIEILAPFGQVNAVGRSFGVLKLRMPGGDQLDVSVPRRDNQAAERGFIAAPDSTMTPREAAARRDFTWNALAITPEGELLDFFGGVADLRAGIIRHTSQAFGEDPLRVLRAMQFAARFDMRLAPETASLCRTLLPAAPALPTERVWGEWWKWAVKGRRPSAGLYALETSGWIELYPQLAALRDCPQDPRHHPEGNVWLHTIYVCDAAAIIAKRDGLPADDHAALVFAALCHDLGKPPTTSTEPDGRIRSPGHAQAGVPLAQSFLKQIGAPHRIVEHVAPLVREHAGHFGMLPTARAVRRLAARLSPANIMLWGRLIEADFGGRPPLPPRAPAASAMQRAVELDVAQGPAAPILRGNDLIAAGLLPGPSLGVVLRRAYQAQLDGAFGTVEEGLKWVAHYADDDPRPEFDQH